MPPTVQARRAPSGAVSALLAVLLFVALCVPQALFPHRVLAMNVGDSVHLETGRSVPYAGYETSLFTAGGAVAYCGQPSRSTPKSGSYATSPIQASNTDRNAEVVADLYFGYGGPGFDPSMWPNTWYDGSPMNDDRYFVLTHLLVSDVYSSDGEAALYGCDEGFKSWVRRNVIGVEDGTEYFASTGWQVRFRLGEVPSGFIAYQIDTGRSQNILSFVPTGVIELHKASENDSITGDNACYSLEGAIYGIYSDETCTSQVATVTTDASGNAASRGVMPGDYWVREISPSRSYALDATAFHVTVSGGGVSELDVSERPQAAPGDALLQKLDADQAGTPQGGATLAGAKFEVVYHDNADGDTSDAPSRTWVFESDEDGHVMFGQSHLDSGDALFTDGDGDVVMPVGTYAVREIQAPQGYNLSDNSVHVAIVRPDGTGEDAVSWSYVDWGGYDTLERFDGRAVADVVERGDYRLVKETSTTVDNESPNDESDVASDNSRVLVPGVRFQLVNASDHAVLSPEDGTSWAEPGEVVCTITTDESGLASTRGGGEVNGWDVPDSWNAALAYGTYTVHEVVPADVNAAFKAEHGFDIPTVQDWKVTIAEEGQYDAPMLVNDKAQTPLRIVKTDAETGRQVPAECSFQLYDSSGSLVTYTSHYPEATTMDTWTANRRGEVTLPMLLGPGTYTVREVRAPEGYALNDAGFTFTVDSSFHGWDDPVSVTVPDTPVRGRIELAKHDAADGSAVAGGEYAVKAASDIVTGDGTVRCKAGAIADTLVTGEDGIATSSPLYLGTYTVYETKSPEGYALDTEEHVVTVSSQEQDVPLVTIRKDVYEAPTELVVNKTDAETALPLSGASFRVWQDGADPAYGYDADGIAAAVSTALDVSSFAIDDEESFEHMVEQAQPGDVVAFAANADGAALELKARCNDDRSITISHASAIEAATKGDVCTVPAAQDVDETAFDQTFSTDAAGRISIPHLAHGTYHVVETATPSGYHLTDADRQVDFTVDDQGFVGIDGGEFSSTLSIDVPNAPDRIGTTATVDGHHYAPISDQVTLTDTVAYEGAVSGREYTVTGTLHVVQLDEDGMKTDGGAVRDAEGNDVTVSTTFTAERQDGTVDVTFTFDASQLAGRTVVAFETMRQGDALFATHADISDEDQSVSFRPSLHTTATDRSDGDHTISSTGTVTIVDTVDYAGLVPGQSYVVSGTLMDKTTGNPVTGADGAPVTARTSFIPETADGSVDVTFSLESSALGGHDTVVFEDLYEGDEQTGTVVSQHRDLDSADQTVSVAAPVLSHASGDAASGGYDKTGDLLRSIWPVLALAVAGALAGAVYGARHRRLARLGSHSSSNKTSHTG